MKRSLKNKFAVAFACVVAVVVVICSLSVYTYEVLISRLEDYSSSLSELNEFRFQFGEFNKTVEEYLGSGSLDSREKYGELKAELTELCKSVSAKYKYSDDKVQSSLAESIDSNFSKYIQQTEELVGSADLNSSKELYQQKYSRNAGYIENYIEKLISSRYKTSAATLEDTNSKIMVFKFVLVFVVVIFAMLLSLIAIMIFRNVIVPLEKLSRQSKQISNLNFDISVDIPKTGDEIEELSASFSKMNDRLKEFFETNSKNIQIIDDMLIQFEGNQELKNYINRQREVNDSIFRQANVDQTSGLMNGKAFMHCVKDDITAAKGDEICAVSVVEITNYSEISNSVYEGVDELVKSTAKKLNYIVGKNGYIARWEKGLFMIFIPDISRYDDIKKLSLDLKNAVDDDFVYKKVKQHVSARVNTLVSHAPKSEKMLVNFVLNGIENVEPGEFNIVKNNIL